MRQGHQNRRGRGRGNNGGQHSNNNNNNQNRKGQNPLTRTFESNGPDVKIRGTPAHIAEKYISLARDAKSSGDEVLAENYLQHAEHYNRIILAFREQQISQGGGDPAAGGQRFRVPQLQDGPDDEDFAEDGDDMGGGEQPIIRSNEPQPSVGGGQPPPFDGGSDRGGEQRDYYRQDNRHERQDRPDRQPERHQGHRFDDRQRRNDHFRNRDNRDNRDRDRDRQGGDYRQQGGERHMDRDRDRPMPMDRDRQFDRPQAPPPSDQASMAPQAERTAQPPMVQAPLPMPAAPVTTVAMGVDPGFEPVIAQRPPRPEGALRGERPVGDENAPQPRRRERFQSPPHEQPEFLRRPVRRPRREAAPVEGVEGEANGAPPAPSRDDPGPAK